MKLKMIKNDSRNIEITRVIMKKVKSKRRGYVNQMQTFLSICLPEEMKNGQYFSIVMLEEV